ncbi:hypothetical protein ACSSS7_003780 [Eimeria intestinalis]
MVEMLLFAILTQLLTRELFSPSRGLFSYNAGVRTLWFQPGESTAATTTLAAAAEPAAEAEEGAAAGAAATAAAAAPGDSSTPSKAEGKREPASGASPGVEEKKEKRPEPPTEKAKEYWLTGLLASMAVYNDILMPLNLPLVVYKRLQGADVSLEDLSDVFPEELNSFEKLLEIEDDATFNAAFEGMTFVVDVEEAGNKHIQVPLKPGGEAIPLTKENRGEFVELYTKHLLVHSVRDQVNHLSINDTQ